MAFKADRAFLREISSAVSSVPIMGTIILLSDRLILPERDTANTPPTLM